MTIALESEIVATRFDPLGQACYYTIERDGKRWTVKIPLSDLDKHNGPNHKALRRNYIATALQNAMRAAPDDDA